MNFKPSSAVVKKSLNAHTWLGLTVGVLMYLICLSGALVVFFEEFERWEQPDIEEYLTYTPEQIETAVGNFVEKVEKVPESIYIILPTDAVPRIHVSGDGKEWFVNSDGSFSEPVKEGWTHMLKELHVQLHLPQTLGIIIVGSLGAMLCGLIVSGLLAHPRIFKDAFTFRLGGSKRLEQADIHNRLSVWGTPFYFMIGLTGAFIGLVGILIATAAPIYFDGDRAAVIDSVYGGDPEIKEAPQKINYQSALEQLKQVEPAATPIYMVVQHYNSEKQFLEIAATLPQRLIYSEMYRFKSDGSFIDYQGLSDGALGKQAAYSVYRLHFGHFDSGWVKVLYGVLGLALTVISVSGINIWLARRKFRSFINDAWVAIVWGTPLALIVSFLVGQAGMSYIFAFWESLIILVITSIVYKQEHKTRQLLQTLTAALLAVCIGYYYVIFDSIGPNEAALKINIGLISTAFTYFYFLIRNYRVQQLRLQTIGV